MTLDPTRTKAYISFVPDYYSSSSSICLAHHHKHVSNAQPLPVRQADLTSPQPDTSPTARLDTG